MLDLSFRSFQRLGACCLLLSLEIFCARAAIELIPDGPEPALFDNGRRSVRVLFRNSGDSAIAAHLEFRLYQASSSTLAPLGDVRPWRLVPLGAGQTVVESIELELPAVRGETGFQVVWFNGKTKLGATSLRIFPDELLKQLTVLGGDAPLGLVDPDGHFKPIRSSVRVQELREPEDISASESRLLLIAPMTAANRPAGLLSAIKKKAASGAAMVWLQSPARRASAAVPETYFLDDGAGRVVIASATTILPWLILPARN
ncbi:MAG: hypothetical protein QOF48_2279 [Verrucomicrobiota bacterium]|jgi:hypothetical protein